MRTHRAPQRSRSQGGFTLLEMLIASSIFLLVLYGVYLIYDAGEAQYTRSTRKWDLQSQARAAIERMGREVRQAGYDASNPVLYPIVIATADTISFQADVGDGNGLQYITYSLRNCDDTKTQTLYRQASTNTYCGGQPFIDNVTDLRFTYFSVGNVPIPPGASMPYTPNPPYQLDNQNYVTGSNAPTAVAVNSDRANIYQVRISLTLQGAVGDAAVPFTINTDVALRNRLH